MKVSEKTAGLRTSFMTCCAEIEVDGKRLVFTITELVGKRVKDEPPKDIAELAVADVIRYEFASAPYKETETLVLAIAEIEL
jgi:hypothetical protein